MSDAPETWFRIQRNLRGRWTNYGNSAWTSRESAKAEAELLRKRGRWVRVVSFAVGPSRGGITLTASPTRAARKA